MARLAWSIVLLSACARLPRPGPGRALYVDLDKIVEDRERSEWVVDRREIEDLSSTSMRSACQVRPASRQRLLRWLDRRIRIEGGPAAEAYRRAGRDLGAVRRLLRLERVRALLADAHARAEADCPFWLEPRRDFAGVQSDAHRLVLLLESAGSFQVVASDGHAAVGGAGGGRVLAATGLGHRVTIATGLELGGAGAFPQDEAGERTLQAEFVAAAPLLLRLHDSTQVWDAELAATGHFSEGDLTSVRPGARVSVGTGLTVLRVGDFQPYGVLWLGYELLPRRDGEPAVHSLRIGTRFGLDWDP